ncbi:hypothetical protein [Streptomyces sp.]
MVEEVERPPVKALMTCRRRHEDIHFRRSARQGVTTKDLGTIVLD